MICVLLENLVLSVLSRYIWFGKPMNRSVLRIVQSLWQTTAGLVPFTAARGSISPVEMIGDHLVTCLGCFTFPSKG